MKNRFTVTHRNNLRHGQRETLEYLQSILGELYKLAAAERLSFVSHLLEIAYIDIGDTLRNSEKTHVAKIPHNDLPALETFYQDNNERRM